MILVAVIALPLLAGLAALVLPVRVGLWLDAFAALGSVGLCAALVALGSDPVPTAFAGYLRADGLAVVLGMVVSGAAACSAFVGVRTFWSAAGATHDARRYAVVAPLLQAALLATAFADHLGVMWIAMELSAVMGTVLVALHGDRATLQAAFKYMMLGSAGLVLSLLATALVYRAGVPVLGEGDTALSFSALKAAAPGLSAKTLRLALALAAVGYGCKVGLFPLHVWKPDAYSAAPAPVAALLAGAAVAVPLGALLRFGALTAGAGQRAFVQELYLAAGLASVLAATLFCVRERDLRRLLAFTSVEHMGLCLLAFGLGSDGARGGLMHLVSNGLLKSLAFGLLGFVVAERGSADAHAGPGLYGRSNTLAWTFLVVVAASVGFPPFGLFASELTVLRTAFATGHTGLAVVLLLALGTVFGVLLAAVLGMLFARADEPLPGPQAHGRVALWVALPALAALVALGSAMPAELFEWLGQVAREIG